MASITYRAEFEIIESGKTEPHSELSNTEKTGQQSKSISNSDIIEKTDKSKKQLLTAAKSAVGTAVAVSAFVYNFSVNEQLTSMSIQGDSVAGRNLQNQRTITNELLQVGGTLLAGALFPPSLFVTVPTLAVKYISKGLDYSNRLQIHNAEVQIDNYLSQQERNKIGQNIKEFR
jgi:hypothetical protein